MVKRVGYGSPPDHAKWVKGQSGNPSGRRKGQRNLKTDLLDELAELIQVTEGGKPRKLTKQRALVKALTARAIKGDARASSLIVTLVMRLIDPEPEVPAASLAADDQALLDAYLAKQTRRTRENDDD